MCSIASNQGEQKRPDLIIFTVDNVMFIVTNVHFTLMNNNRQLFKY